MIERRGRRIEPLFSAEQIAERNAAMAEDIVDANLQNLLVVAILKGSFVFAADLIRALHNAGLSPEVEFISVSSYGAGTKAGKPKVLRDVESDVTARDVLLLDDILESGGTLAFTRQLMQKRGANRVLTAVLLDKPGNRVNGIKADFCGFECPDRFVVGYGMDVGHAFRELPFVGAVVDDE